MMIRYQSPNGYRGVLYGESSMMIYDPSARLVLHTEKRSIETPEELKDFVDKMPETLEQLKEDE